MNIPQQHPLMTFLLSTPLPLPVIHAAQDMQSWQLLAQQQYPQWQAPFERSVVGGFCSLNMATAFTSGYQGALQVIAPSRVDYNAASFCVTEQAGNKPAAITTSLASDSHGNWILQGAKSFVSGAEYAKRLLVAATTGQDAQGRNRLQMVWVDTNQPGVTITPLPTLPFAPELSHGTVSFDQVCIGPHQMLQGDGYSDYVKPFRTVEDIHVSGALLGYLTRIARHHDLPAIIVENLLALILLHQTLALQQPSAATTHLGLAGARTLLENSLDRLEPLLASANQQAADIWQRDKALLKVAAKARAQRTQKAWEILTATPT